MQVFLATEVYPISLTFLLNAREEPVNVRALLFLISFIIIQVSEPVKKFLRLLSSSLGFTFRLFCAEITAD